MTQDTTLRTFEFCDVATVRDGLMTVVNGGLNQLPRQEFPSTLGAFIAISVEIADISASPQLSIRVAAINESDTETKIPPYEWAGVVEETAPSADHHSIVFSLAVDARNLPLQSPGRYRFDLEVNDRTLSTVRLEATLNS